MMFINHKYDCDTYFEYQPHPRYALLIPAPPMSCVNMASPTYLGSRLLRIRRWLQGEELECIEGT